MHIQFNSIHQHLFPPRIITLEKTITIETIKLTRGGITQEGKAYKQNALNTNKKYTKVLNKEDKIQNTKQNNETKTDRQTEWT